MFRSLAIFKLPQRVNVENFIGNEYDLIEVLKDLSRFYETQKMFRERRRILALISRIKRGTLSFSSPLVTGNILECECNIDLSRLIKRKIGATTETIEQVVTYTPYIWFRKETNTLVIIGLSLKTLVNIIVDCLSYKLFNSPGKISRLEIHMRAFEKIIEIVSAFFEKPGRAFRIILKKAKIGQTLFDEVNIKLSSGLADSIDAYNMIQKAQLISALTIETPPIGGKKYTIRISKNGEILVYTPIFEPYELDNLLLRLEDIFVGIEDIL